MDNGVKCYSGRVIFQGQFIDNISIEDIPYYGIIDNLECHLIIEGRASKCFTCHKVGHKSVQCLKAYCKKCNLVLFKNHLCILHNGQSLLNNENIEISDSQVEAISENKNIACSNNLFQNLNLNFSNNVSNEIKSDNLMEFTSTQSNLVTISERKIRSDEKIDKWFTEGGKTENVFRNNNPYITEEVDSKDPNFILIDTSSEESDSEGEMSSNFMQQADWCMTDMNKYAEVSRKLVQDSMIFLKQNTEASNSLGTQLDKVSPSHVINNKFSIEDTGVKDICMQTDGRLQSDIEKVTIKKKRKQKRKHK